MYIIIYIHIHISSRGDDMKIVKSMALIAMGAGAVLAYQKYSEPLMNKMEEIAYDAMKKADKKLEDMM